MLYNFLKVIAPFFLFPFLNLEVNGLENISSEEPLVIVSNHTSNWDPIILAISLPRKLSFMAKEELFKVFIIGKIIANLGAISVRRGAADRNAIRQSIKVLENDGALFMFPEGTRSKTGEVQNFLPGAALIAYRGQATILPVGLQNTRNIGKGLRTKVAVNIGQPLEIGHLLEGRATGKKMEEITELIRDKVIELVEN